MRIGFGAATSGLNGPPAARCMKPRTMGPEPPHRWTE